MSLLDAIFWGFVCCMVCATWIISMLIAYSDPIERL